LLVFGAIIYGIYLAWGDWQWILASLMGGGIVFVLLIKLFAHTQFSKRRMDKKIQLLREEIQSLHGDFSFRPSGKKYLDPTHLFANDLDLFGEHSFFQFINRTQLEESEQLLASLLIANNIENIEERQEAIKELSQLDGFRLDYTTDASLVNTEVKSTSLLRWMASFTPYIPSYFKVVTTLFSVISVLLLVAYFLSLLSGYFVLAWFFVGLFISGRFLKRTNQLSARLDKAQSLFEQYHYLVAHIENTSFESSFLQSLQQRLLAKGAKEKASKILHAFAKRIDALDQRNNFLLGVFLNAFFLWDIRQTLHIQNWISAHQLNVESWLESIYLLDAYNSLGNFAAQQPHFHYPNITTKEGLQMESKNAVHPLIKKEKVIPNSFAIQQREFFIITGANMAGKSTFLRTLGLQIVMANVGLPVGSETCSYAPIKLISSMRTNDSLADESSYFFAELSRLKMIVETIAKDDYFIILDEILKGTNSTDKAIGSKKFIQKLIRLKSTGVIATHDLSLCELEETFDEIKNYYFDASIVNNELFFDYKMKDGICQNMNASFLLKKMEIVD
jgi:ABC-type multidrug transport system fused ATPase/permease subunit